MKRKFLVLAVILITSLCYAFEWGGVITDDTKLTTNFDSIKFHQSNSASLWSNINFGNSGTTYLTTQGTFKYYLDLEKDEEPAYTPLFNLDLLKFSTIGKFSGSSISFSMGRFFTSDFTSKIFSQACDGASLELTYPVINVGAYVGYTGLLNSNEVSILDSDGNIHSEAHGYLPSSLTISFPTAFLNQHIALQMLAIFDTPDFVYNRYYGTVIMKGPIVGPLGYSLSTVFGSENFENVMNYSNLSISFTPSQMISISLGGNYASGKILFLEPFAGFTSCTAYNSIDYPELSGVILPYVSMSFIQQKFCSLLNVAGVFTMPESDIEFKGIDATITMIFNIYSDLQVNFKAIGFWDLSSEADKTNMSFDLSAAISF